jgi:hypothetical protein
MAERKRRGILGHPNVVRRTLVAAPFLTAGRLVVSSGLAHHNNKGNQGVISCLPPLTTCPHSMLWRTQEQKRKFLPFLAVLHRNRGLLIILVLNMSPVVYQRALWRKSTENFVGWA